MLFKDVIGHNELKVQLIQTVKDNRVSHAQMFYGVPGIGKLALALAYAQYVCCTNKKDDDSCGECPSCKKYAKLIHPDLHFVFPVVSNPKGKNTSDSYIEKWREKVLDSPYFNLSSWLDFLGAENKQASIFKDEAVEVIRKLNLKTFESEYKVMIIWLPEKMNNAMANRLLKILEEPPDKTLFLFVSDSREDVLKTVLSRTQPINIYRLKDTEIQKALVDNLNLDLNEAEDISVLARGSYIEALNQFSASETRLQNFEYFKTLMRIAYKKDVVNIISFVKEISVIGREKQKSFLEYASKMMRENFIINQKAAEFGNLLKSEKAFADKFSQFVSKNNVTAITDELTKAHYHISRNVKPDLVFLDTAFKVMNLIKNV